MTQPILRPASGNQSPSTPSVSVILLMDGSASQARLALGELCESDSEVSEFILVRSGAPELRAETEALALQFRVDSWVLLNAGERGSMVDRGMALARGDVVVVRSLDEVSARPLPRVARRSLERVREVDAEHDVARGLNTATAVAEQGRVRSMGVRPG